MKPRPAAARESDRPRSEGVQVRSCLAILLCCSVPLRAIPGQAWAEDGSAARAPGANLALGKTVLFDTPPNDRSATDPDDIEGGQEDHIYDETRYRLLWKKRQVTQTKLSGF